MRFLTPLLVALLGGGLLFWATDGLQALTSEGARRVQVARAPALVPDVTLQAMSGQSISLRPASGEIVLVEFIYTNCPTICQTAGDDFARLRDRLLSRDVKVRLISISFDPVRDDLAAMRDYAGWHDADGTVWTIARPAPEQLPQLLKFFQVTVIPDEWGGYEHNAAILLIDSAGRFAGVFDTDALTDVEQAIEARS